MASFKKDNKTVEGARGLYQGTIKDFKSKGIKITKNGDVFENGYLEVLLKNGVVLSQYIMITPYNNHLFYKFLEAIGLTNKINEYVDFPFYEMFEKEVVVELEYQSVRESTYLNVTNVFSLVKAEKLMQFQRAKEELRRRSGSLNMSYIEMMNEKRLNTGKETNGKEEVSVNEEVLGDKYEELIDF